MKISCKDKGGFKDQFGNVHYHNCDYKVYCTVTYRKGTDGKFTTYSLCKKHFNALVKNCERVKRITGWESELTYEIINT